MINCLIIDDEPLAREVLESYVEEIPELFLVKSCKNALDARELLNRESVDLIFLDINMPQLSGLSFYKTLVNKPKVIFTTAYAEHAVEGFELNATDYLLKPISFERFEKAVEKVLLSTSTSQDFMMLKADKRIHKINFNQIRYFESIGDYVKVHIEDKSTLIISDTLKKLIRELPSIFLRVHKSYIINTTKLEFIEGNSIRLGEENIPIGQSYREQVNRTFKR